MQVTQNSTQM